MAAESDLQLLLTYYNSQIALGTTQGNTCAATIAAQINTILQSKLNKPPSVELNKDMLSLLQQTEDVQVLSKQSTRTVFLWLVVVSILLWIIVFLWNFK
jgi:hypothetical protein